MSSAVEAAAKIAGDEDFLLFTGDFVRHGQDRMPDPYANVTSTVADVTSILNRGFRSLDAQRMVVGALGNDDSPRNYELNITTDLPRNPWLATLAARFFVGSSMPPARVSEYEYGGFFEARLGAITILNINTLIYSVRHSPVEPMLGDPFGQFAWLRGRLELASQENRSVWIVGHIAPGMETYGYTPLWRPEYVDAYLQLVQDPVLGASVAAQLFGHVHADEFRILPRAPDGAGPLLLSGALSPIYHCNPGFRRVEYDAESGRLLGIQVYWAQLAPGSDRLQWQFGYDMVHTYPALSRALKGAGGLTNAAFQALAASLKHSWAAGGSEFGSYAAWYKTQYRNDLQRCELHTSVGGCNISREAKERYMGKYWCALEVTGGEEFQECAKPHSAQATSAPSQVADVAAPAYYHAARRAHWSSILDSGAGAAELAACVHVDEVADV